MQPELISCLLLLCLLEGVQAYQVEFQDCRDSTLLERFMESTACAAETTPGEQPLGKTYAILTESTTREVAGWSCELLKTEWRSQLRLAALPYIRKHVQLSVEECRNMNL